MTTRIWFAQTVVEVCRFCKEPLSEKQMMNHRLFCSVSCANKHRGLHRRRVQISRLKTLHNEEWLSRKEIAERLGVRKAAINSAVYRHKLNRLNPSICKVPDCGNPTHRYRHARGYMTGTLCLEHHRERMRKYVAAYRRRKRPLLTREQQAEKARRASLIRWAKAKVV